MPFPTTIEGWLRMKGFVCERVEETISTSAIRIVADNRGKEWSKAILQRNGLLILRPTSASDPTMTGLLLSSLTITNPGAVAEALDHLMTTSARTQLLEGIEAHRGGCLIEGLGTARAAFSAAR